MWLRINDNTVIETDSISCFSIEESSPSGEKYIALLFINGRFVTLTGNDAKLFLQWIESHIPTMEDTKPPGERKMLYAIFMKSETPQAVGTLTMINPKVRRSPHRRRRRNPVVRKRKPTHTYRPSKAR